MAGRDSLLVLPTGGGKSLCFQAPALARDGLAVVVSPLISLMKDQVDTLVGNGVAAACYNSAMPAEQKSDVARGVREGKYRLLYVAPERLVGDGGDGFQNLLLVAAGQLHRRGRGALHQPVGPRLPPRVPAARAVARSLAVDRPARLHRHRHRARPQGHRRAAWPARRDRAGGLVRSSQPRLPRARALVAQDADPRRARAASRPGRHHLLHLPQGSRSPGAVAAGHRLARAAVSRRSGRTRSGIATRTRSSTRTSIWSSRRWRSAWASIDRMCAS